jgi:hypothetical protein
VVAKHWTTNFVFEKHWTKIISWHHSISGCELMEEEFDITNAGNDTYQGETILFSQETGILEDP